MQAPLQISFHGLDRSEALEAKIRAQAEKFEQFCDRITGCHVVLEKPHTYTVAYRRMPDYTLLEYVCEDNREYADDKGLQKIRVN